MPDALAAVFPPRPLIQLFIIVFLVCFSVSEGWSAEPTPRELASQLHETLSGLHTVEMRYRQTLSGAGKPHTSNCEWLRKGNKTRLIMRGGDMPSGWWSFDGRHGYSVEYVPGRPQEMRGILLTSSPPQMLDLMYSPPNWLGLHVRTDPAVALTDMLTGGQARVTEIEEYEGSPAYRVDLGVHEKAAEGPWSWSAVVCPSRDGLPVEISSAPADTNPDHDRLSDTLGRVRFLVTEFQEVEDSALRRKRWMPRKMTLEVGNTRWELEASSVSVNHVIPAGAFVPKPQPGTEMIDDTVPGKRRVRTYKPEAALARRAEMLADQARNGPVPPSSSPVASPPDPMFWSRIAMWGGALSLLGAAVFFIVRSRNARSS